VGGFGLSGTVSEKTARNATEGKTEGAGHNASYKGQLQLVQRRGEPLQASVSRDEVDMKRGPIC
jgi:hypothetical protein